MSLDQNCLWGLQQITRIVWAWFNLPRICQCMDMRRTCHCDRRHCIIVIVLGWMLTPYHFLSSRPDDSLLTIMTLPWPEKSKFSGEPTKYMSFITAFEQRAVPHKSPDMDRLYYLGKYLEGKPKCLIEGCFHMKDEGCIAARRMLYDEYGNAYLNQWCTWVNCVHGRVWGKMIMSVWNKC